MLSVQAVAQFKFDAKKDLETGTTFRKAQLDNLDYAAKNDNEASIRAMAHLARVTVRGKVEEDDLMALLWMTKGFIEKGKKSIRYPEETIRILGAQAISMIGKDAISEKAAKIKIGKDDA